MHGVQYINLGLSEDEGRRVRLNALVVYPDGALVVRDVEPDACY